MLQRQHCGCSCGWQKGTFGSGTRPRTPVTQDCVWYHNTSRCFGLGLLLLAFCCSYSLHFDLKVKLSELNLNSFCRAQWWLAFRGKAFIIQLEYVQAALTDTPFTPNSHNPQLIPSNSRETVSPPRRCSCYLFVLVLRGMRWRACRDTHGNTTWD